MQRVRVLIEAPRGSFVKRRADGRIDYVAPLPVPFDYGCVPDRLGGDGDPLDALVLGTRLGRGALAEVGVYGVVRFLDGGRVDDKLVCAERPPTDAEWRRVRTFFAVFGRAKAALNAVRGVRGVTAVVAIERGQPT